MNTPVSTGLALKGGSFLTEGIMPDKPVGSASLKGQQKGAQGTESHVHSTLCLVATGYYFKSREKEARAGLGWGRSGPHISRAFD